MEALTRSNRFSYDPILDENGKPMVADIQPHDDRRFEALASFEYLTADYIAGLTGGDEKSVTHRFNILKRQPNRWIDIAAPQLANMKQHRHDFLAYSLSERAVKRLTREKHKEIRAHGCTGPFNHKLMTGWIRASFDIAEKIEKVAAQIIPFHVIKASSAKTREDKAAHCITVSFRYGGQTRPYRVFPDCYPFALETDQHVLLFLETDCDSEAIENDLDLKLMRWISIFEQNLHRERYGFTKAYVLLVTTSPVHMQNIIKRLHKLTEHRPPLRKYFLFKRHPSPKSDDRPRPTGHMLTEPWQRAGLPLFNLLTGKDA
jgi:hypothetical protein